MLRRSPRALARWAAALAVALVTAGIVGSDLAALHRRAHAFGPDRPAVVATRDLLLGDTVRDGDVEVRRTVRAALPSGAVPSPAAAVGRVVAVPMLRGTVVSTRHLTPHGRGGLDAAVPAGMRAVRIVATDSLRPRAGALVDVLATFQGSSTTVTVAARVVVLRTDQPGSAATSSHGDAIGVTLLVNPDQATRLAGAAAFGVINLALVPPTDARASTP